MQEQLIYDIENVEVGDIAYYEGAEKGSIVVAVDSHDDNSRLKIETPEVFKPFYLYSDTPLWLQNSYFKHAIRPTQNTLVEKSLPEVQEGHSRGFETPSGTRIVYDGTKFRGRTAEPTEAEIEAAARVFFGNLHYPSASLDWDKASDPVKDNWRLKTRLALTAARKEVQQ